MAENYTGCSPTRPLLPQAINASYTLSRGTRDRPLRGRPLAQLLYSGCTGCRMHLVLGEPFWILFLISTLMDSAGNRAGGGDEPTK